MRKVFDVIVERDEDGRYVGTVPQLPGCHTQARSLDTLLKRIREAIQLCTVNTLTGAQLSCPFTPVKK